MRTVLDNTCEENQTRILYSTNYPPLPPENRAFLGYCTKMFEIDRPQMKIQRMRFSCWITRATNIHSDYVVLIAFPRQEWFRECAPQCHVIRALSLLFPPSTLRFSKCMESLPISVVFPLEKGTGKSAKNEGLHELLG